MQRKAPEILKLRKRKSREKNPSGSRGMRIGRKKRKGVRNWTGIGKISENARKRR